MASLRTHCGRVLIALADWTQRHAATVTAATVAGILTGGFFYCNRMSDALRYSDETEYAGIATNLVAHGCFSLDGVNPTAIRPPGYPALIATVFRMGLGIFTVRMLNYFALALLIVILFRFLNSHYTPLSAACGALLIAGYPLYFYTAGTLFPQTVTSLLFIAALTLAFGAPAPGPRRSIGIGILLAR